MFTLIGTILKNAFGRPATRLYPFVKRPLPPGVRGRLDVEIDKCVYCTLCAKRCPANAITVDREARCWTLNPWACIVCGYCAEACPKKCLSMKPEHDGTSAAATRDK